MLCVGRTKITRADLQHTVTLVRGDAVRLPIRDESVDAATIAFGIRNVEQPEVACRELNRVLKRGGRIAILEFAIPTMPLVRAVYMTYFRHILPRLGRAISRHDTAYAYLPASVNTFKTPEEFVKILRQSGFVEIQPVSLTFGAVFLYTGRKGLPNPY
jgi:demethylmenaquinone methyltransferase/2-methoxy-6-polyprenyl-1,4-benzoquinol methylase